MPVVQITEETPREAVRWWSKATGIPVVIDWSELARNWPEPPARINLELRQVEARTVLRLVTDQIGSPSPLIIETTGSYA